MNLNLNRQRQPAVIGGMIILIAITLLSGVSSFIIYRESFRDLPRLLEVVLAFAACLTVEGAFVWLLYGYANSFCSTVERVGAIAGMIFLVAAMMINLITHSMLVKKLALHPFQDAWLAWGAIAVFMGTLVLALLIRLGDPESRLRRLNLRVNGMEQEAVIVARQAALESEQVQAAIEKRITIEAERIAAQIVGQQQQSLNGSFQKEDSRPKERRHWI